MSELLPCPFCGAEPKGEDACPGNYDEGPSYAWVGCATEDCPGDCALGDTYEQAVALWNRRSPSLAAAELRGAAKERERIVAGIRERARGIVKMVPRTVGRWWVLDVADMIEGGMGPFAEEPAPVGEAAIPGEP